MIFANVVIWSKDCCGDASMKSENGSSVPLNELACLLASIQPRTSPKKFESSSSREFEVKLKNFKAPLCSPGDLRDAAVQLLAVQLQRLEHRDGLVEP